MRSLRPLLRRLQDDQDLRHRAAFAVVIPIYGVLIAAAFWWGISSG